MNRCCRGSGYTLIVAGMLTGCKSDQPRPADQAASNPTASSAESGLPAVQIVANDYAFEAPAKIPAGLTTLQLTNQGKELHHAQLVKFEQGKTVKDLAQALKNPGPPPEWLRFVGGPNAVVPGKQANATSVLEPGHYAFLCVIFGPDMVLHAAKGMVRELEVTGPAPTAAALPPADVTIRLVDYAFEPSGPITPGRRTILVENAGPQPHELALVRLAPGKTVEDFGHWAEGGLKGAPPAEPIGGVVFLDKGASGTFTVDLQPGTYGLICFVPDAKDGKPHLAHGMLKEIKVG
jgi:uncharacterized cupredoxin-like copper-binding protein